MLLVIQRNKIVREADALTQELANEVGRGNTEVFKLWHDKFWRLAMCGNKLRWVSLAKDESPHDVLPEEKA